MGRLGSDGLKEAMNESPERYTNPFLSDEESEKVNLWTQEVDHSNTEDDKLVTSLTPPEFCKKETELYKDICVDEGKPHEERVLFDENNNKKLLKPEPLSVSTIEDYNMESNISSEINGKIDTGLTPLEPTNDHINIEDNHDEVIKMQPDASSGGQEVHADLTVNEPVNDQDLQNSTPHSNACGTDEEVIDFIVSKELISKAVDDNGPEVSLQPGEEQNLPLPSLKSRLEMVDQQPCQSPVDKTKPATSSGAPKLLYAGSDNVLVFNRGSGESSFSAAGPTSGLVANSGHIGFSGSTSIRSDSSTTSTRSFAFPILQNEWNSSPVRMAKAERGRLQKRCGWRHGLLCFRF